MMKDDLSWQIKDFAPEQVCQACFMQASSHGAEGYERHGRPLKILKSHRVVFAPGEPIPMERASHRHPA
jgi:hypothetical protein